MRRMTDVEMEHYLKQVDRRGNALKKSEEVRQKYAAEFEKINTYLVNNWKWFMVSNTVRHNRYADCAVWNDFVEKESNLIEECKGYRNDGNLDKFLDIAWLMHLKYMTMWRERHDVGL